MKFTRREFGALAAGASAMALSSCAKPGAEGKPNEIVYLTSRPEEQTQVILDGFAEAHPEIAVRVQRYPFKQFLQQAEVLLGGGGEVDVVDVDGPLITSYSRRGYLQPLGERLGQEFIDSTYLEGPREDGYVDGEFYAAPMQSGGVVTFVNRELFEAAGVTPPPGLRDLDGFGDDELAALSEQTWTWEQVVEASRTIKQRTGKFGFLINQPDVAFQMFPFAESLEQPSVSPDGLTSDGYLNSAKWKQVGRFWHDVNNKDEIHPKGLTTDETLPFFQAGNAALFVAGAQYQDQLGPMSEQGEMDLDVAPHPYFEGGRRVNTSGSWAMGIGRNSEKQDAATEFIRFYTGPEGSKLWTKITGRPATFAAREDQLNNPENRKFPAATKLLAVYESDRFGVSRPKTVGYLELEAVVTSTCADIRNGADPDKALENAVTVLDRQLEKYRRR